MAAAPAEDHEGAGLTRWEAWLRAPVLTVAGEVLDGRDLVAAGAISGRWRSLESDLATGLALSAAGPPERSALDAAVRELRYARRLTSAADFRSWLAERDLSLADVRSAIARELLRDQNAAGRAEPPAADRAAMLAALPAEAICTGALREIGWWLADRLLTASAPGAVAEDRLDEALAAEEALVAVAALEEGEPARRERLGRMLAADAALSARVEEILSDDAIAACVDAHRFDWLAFELEGLSCDRPLAAAEAALMLREDQLPLADVARAACLEVAERSVMLEHVPEPLATALTGAAAGDVVGPLEVDGAHEVWRVVARRVPDRLDPGVRARAVAHVLGAELERRRAGRVRWHERA